MKQQLTVTTWVKDFMRITACAPMIPAANGYETRWNRANLRLYRGDCSPKRFNDRSAKKMNTNIPATITAIAEAYHANFADVYTSNT